MGVVRGVLQDEAEKVLEEYDRSKLQPGRKGLSISDPSREKARMSSEHEKFMAMAIEEMRGAIQSGERPFGSVVVREGEIVGRGRNIVNSTGDPTAHAETMAVRNTAANLKGPILSDCTLYTSCHPCPMCAWATVASGAQGIVIGASIDTLRSESGGSYDLKDYSIERLLELTGFQMEVVTEVLEEEVERAFREYGDWSTASPNVLRSGE